MNAVDAQELMAIEEATAPSIATAERDALFAAGHLLYQREDLERAADVFRFLVLADVLDYESWWALGACHERLEDWETAAAAYEHAHRIGEANVEVALLWVRALLRSEHEAASDALDEVRALDMTPTERSRWMSLEQELLQGRGVIQ